MDWINTPEGQDAMLREQMRHMFGVPMGDYVPKRSSATEASCMSDAADAMAYAAKAAKPFPVPDLDKMKRLKARVLRTTVRSPSGKIRELQTE